MHVESERHAGPASHNWRQKAGPIARPPRIGSLSINVVTCERRLGLKPIGECRLEFCWCGQVLKQTLVTESDRKHAFPPRNWGNLSLDAGSNHTVSGGGENGVNDCLNYSCRDFKPFTENLFLVFHHVTWLFNYDHLIVVRWPKEWTDNHLEAILYMAKFFFSLPFPERSAVGPVLGLLPVTPLFRVQSNSSRLSWVNRHNDLLSKLQNTEKAGKKLKGFIWSIRSWKLRLKSYSPQNWREDQRPNSRNQGISSHGKIICDIGHQKELFHD